MNIVKEKYILLFSHQQTKRPSDACRVLPMKGAEYTKNMNARTIKAQNLLIKYQNFTERTIKSR